MFMEPILTFIMLNYLEYPKSPISPDLWNVIRCMEEGSSQIWNRR